MSDTPSHNQDSQERLNRNIIVSSMTNATYSYHQNYAAFPFIEDVAVANAFTLISIVVGLLLVATIIVAYTLRCVWYFTGRHAEKRVYYTWKHGKSTVNLLSSPAYIVRANVAIAELVANGDISQYECYDTGSVGSPLKIFRYCGCCCWFQQLESVRAPTVVFRALPGYPDFNPVSVQQHELEQHHNTVIDI